MDFFFHRKSEEEILKAWTKEKTAQHQEHLTTLVSHEWEWEFNGDTVWCSAGRRVLWEGTESLWSLGVRQVFLPVQCIFVVRWLSSSDWFWQGVRPGSKSRAFSMISCQPSFITHSLYLSLARCPNLFLSLLIQLPLYPLKTCFFLLAHPISPFHSPFLLCALLTWDEKGGVLMRAYQSSQT